MTVPDEKFLDANGLLWENGGEDTDDHLGHGGHEAYLVDVGRHAIPTGGCFLDVGAHVGLWSLNMARGRAAAVIAVEANPNTFATLKKNIANNETVLDGLISAHNVAAWDSVTELTMVDENGKQAGGSTRCVEPFGAEQEALDFGEDTAITIPSQIPALPLDDWIHTKIDFIKIDVEGAEARVLRGASKIIKHDRPVLFIEMHDKFDYVDSDLREQVIAILDEQKYTWNDHLKFGGTYYILAHPEEAHNIPDRPEPA